MTTFLRESTIVFRRQIRMNLRNPAWVLIGVMQPVLYLVLFGPLLKPLVAQFPGGADNPYTFLVPGLLVQLGLFGALFAGFSLIGEWREGVIEAERVTPASRTADADDFLVYQDLFPGFDLLFKNGKNGFHFVFGNLPPDTIGNRRINTDVQYFDHLVHLRFFLAQNSERHLSVVRFQSSP